MDKHSVSRRRLLAGNVAAGIAVLRPGLLTSPAAAAPGDAWRGLKLGVASYTLRKLPLDAAIQAIQRVGLSYVSIKDFHLSLKSTAEERKAAVQKFRDAGITPLSCGVITMQNDEANIRHAFEYAKDAGFPTIVCSPHPDSLPILDRMVKDYNIRLAIHNHGPEDKKFPGPYDVMKAIEAYDRRIGLCIDVGHTARVKVDPAEAIRKCRDRLYDVHLKDLANTEPKAANLEIGRGVLDLKAMLNALVEIKFTGHVGIEYEIHADDPIPGLAESVGYLRGIFRSA